MFIIFILMLHVKRQRNILAESGNMLDMLSHAFRPEFREIFILPTDLVRNQMNMFVDVLFVCIVHGYCDLLVHIRNIYRKKNEENFYHTKRIPVKKTSKYYLMSTHYIQ